MHGICARVTHLLKVIDSSLIAHRFFHTVFFFFVSISHGCHGCFYGPLYDCLYECAYGCAGMFMVVFMGVFMAHFTAAFMAHSMALLKNRKFILFFYFTILL